jgi:hypothetical protein
LFQHLGYAPKEWFLTYVNELLEQSKAIDDSDVIKIKIFDVFDDVKKYISEDDLTILKRELDLLLCG